MPQQEGYRCPQEKPAKQRKEEIDSGKNIIKLERFLRITCELRKYLLDR